MKNIYFVKKSFNSHIVRKSLERARVLFQKCKDSGEEKKTVNLDMEGLTLMFEQLFLERDASWCGETAHFTISAYNAVAGDDKRQGISGHHTADGPARGGPACSFRQFRISYRLAGFYFSASR